MKEKNVLDICEMKEIKFPDWSENQLKIEAFIDEMYRRLWRGIPLKGSPGYYGLFCGMSKDLDNRMKVSDSVRSSRSGGGTAKSSCNS